MHKRSEWLCVWDEGLWTKRASVRLLRAAETQEIDLRTSSNV